MQNKINEVVRQNLWAMTFLEAFKKFRGDVTEYAAVADRAVEDYDRRFKNLLDQAGAI